MTTLQGERTIMVQYDYEYLEQRAIIERGHAERAGNPYVKACHQRLARSYEQAAANLLRVPRDWPVELLDQA
jgi:hypothetical protein